MLGHFEKGSLGQTCTLESATHSSNIIFIRTESYGEGFTVGHMHSESEDKKRGKESKLSREYYQ